MSAGEFGIYVHWPICAAKCPYCDFNSHVRSDFSEIRWAEAIGRELAAAAALQNTRPTVSSIFFGGGTPSLMSGRAVARVIETIASLWPLAPNAEITLEANPNSAEAARFRDYKAAGVNRLSIGVQAFDDESLKALGRLHGAAEARAAIRMAQDVFTRVSFDLIYTRSGQTLVAWQRELDEALAFGTEHLSLYQLTIEPGTAFATLARQGKLSLPPEEDAARFFEVTQERCDRAGLPAYEISNHARAGAQSRHNLIYWRYGDYVGVGPGAHGRLTRGDRRVATLAERLPERWLAAVEKDGHSLTTSEIHRAEGAREHLLMVLRLSEGIDLSEYRVRWGEVPPEEKMRALAEHGLIEHSGNHLRATPKGRLVLNAVIAELAN